MNMALWRIPFIFLANKQITFPLRSTFSLFFSYSSLPYYLCVLLSLLRLLAANHYNHIHFSFHNGIVLLCSRLSHVFFLLLVFAVAEYKAKNLFKIFSWKIFYPPKTVFFYVFLSSNILSVEKTHSLCVWWSIYVESGGNMRTENICTKETLSSEKQTFWHCAFGCCRISTHKNCGKGIVPNLESPSRF